MTRARDVADTQDNLGGAVAPVVSGKNAIINGGFDVSQRGSTITGISSDNTYTADRWYVTRGGNLDYALKTVAGGNNPPSNFNSYGQFMNKSASNPFIAVLQTLETADSMRFAGKIATLSFYARATADTAKSKSLIADIGYNTTADTKSNTYVGSTTFTIGFGTAATDWTYCTLTATIPSNAKTVGTRTYQAPAGGLAVNDGFEITGVQLEIGSVATPFARAGGSIGGELALCQRYYEKSYDVSTAPAAADQTGSFGWAGGVNNSSATYFTYTPVFKVTKRSTPTITIYDFAGNSGKVSKVSAVDLSFTNNETGTVDRIGQSEFRIYSLLSTAAGFYGQFVASAEL